MKFHLDETALTITLEGWERVWAIRRKVVIPWENIDDITWSSQGVYLTEGRTLRAGGTSWPSAFYAGHFYEPTNKRWHFLYVKHPLGWIWNGGFTAPDLLVIKTHNYSFAGLALTVEQDIGERIVAYWEDAQSRPTIGPRSASRPKRPSAARSE